MACIQMRSEVPLKLMTFKLPTTAVSLILFRICFIELQASAVKALLKI